MKSLKIAIVGRKKEDVDILISRIKQFSNFFVFSEKKPEMVISFGGDGSFLYAERKYPGVPKLILRHKSICKKCVSGPLEVLLSKIMEGDYEIKKENKLFVEIRKSTGVIVKKLAVNDVVVSNRLPYRALRFKYSVNEEAFSEVVGDGIVVATGFGSTGYFNSITRKSFEDKVGLAFNNPTEKMNCIVEKDLKVALEVVRSDAYVSVDNDPRLVKIKEGDKVFVRKCNEEFYLVQIKIPKEEIL